MESLSKKKMVSETALKPTYAASYNSPSHFTTIDEEEEEDDEDYSEDEYSEYSEYSEEEEEFEPKPYKQMPTIDDYSKLTPNVYDHEVKVVEINCDDEDEDDEDSDSNVISSSDYIPSLSYSSEEESEDEFETVPVKRQEISLTPDHKASATSISITSANDVLAN